MLLLTSNHLQITSMCWLDFKLWSFPICLSKILYYLPSILGTVKFERQWGDPLVFVLLYRYPNPSGFTYENRFFRPFEYALQPPPCYKEEHVAADKPELPCGVSDLKQYDGPQCFVIPGNHGWSYFLVDIVLNNYYSTNRLILFRILFPKFVRLEKLIWYNSVMVLQTGLMDFKPLWGTFVIRAGWVDG